MIVQHHKPDHITGQGSQNIGQILKGSSHLTHTAAALCQFHSASLTLQSCHPLYRFLGRISRVQVDGDPREIPFCQFLGIVTLIGSRPPSPLQQLFGLVRPRLLQCLLEALRDNQHILNISIVEFFLEDFPVIL